MARGTAGRLRSFSVDELLDTVGEVISLLRDPYSHGGQHRAYLTDCADAEFLALWECCELVDLDPRGIPCWSPGGRVRGLSTRTTSTHIGYMVADLVDRMPLDDGEIHRLLWRARLSSIGASKDVASLMSQVRDLREEDEFAQWRAEDAGAA